MVDYVKLQTTAIRLIKKNGRKITFVRLNENANDSNKPWKGPPVNGENTFDLDGIFVPPSAVKQFGLTALGEGTEFQDLIAMSEQIIITAQAEADLRIYTEVVDRSERWGIIGLQVLRPGDLGLLAFVGVRR